MESFFSLQTQQLASPSSGYVTEVVLEGDESGDYINHNNHQFQISPYLVIIASFSS